MTSTKIAIVTGTGSVKGIGRAICNKLADSNTQVIALDIELITDLNNPLIATMQCDVTNKKPIANCIEKVLGKYKKIDYLVNNAGVGVGSDDFLQLTDNDWSLSFDVNVKGAVNLCQAVIPTMLNQGLGAIVNIASLAGLGAMEGMPATYTASKFALVGLTKQIATQYAKHGIRCNAICPGSIVTDMHSYVLQQIAEQHDISIDEAQQIENSHIPMGYSATPDKVADAVAFLLSDQASYLTGVNLPVAGGMSAGL